MSGRQRAGSAGDESAEAALDRATDEALAVAASGRAVRPRERRSAEPYAVPRRPNGVTDPDPASGPGSDPDPVSGAGPDLDHDLDHDPGTVPDPERAAEPYPVSDRGGRTDQPAASPSSSPRAPAPRTGPTSEAAPAEADADPSPTADPSSTTNLSPSDDPAPASGPTSTPGPSSADTPGPADAPTSAGSPSSTDSSPPPGTSPAGNAAPSDGPTQVAGSAESVGPARVGNCAVGGSRTREAGASASTGPVGDGAGAGPASDGAGRVADAGHAAAGGVRAGVANSRGHRGSVSWAGARTAAVRAVSAPLPAAPTPLGEALGRVLAEPLTALTDLPPFDTSAMDGWALAGPGPWRLPARGRGVLAGHARPEPLEDGQAVRIATGARTPPGATAVLRSEHGTERDGRTVGPSARAASSWSNSSCGHHADQPAPGTTDLAAATGGPEHPRTGESAHPRTGEPEHPRTRDGRHADPATHQPSAPPQGPDAPPPDHDRDHVHSQAQARNQAHAQYQARAQSGGQTQAGWVHALPGHPVQHGQDIRPRGQECGRGDQLLPAGTLVTPAVLGLAAAAGYDELVTVRRPRAEVLVLGDELLRSGLPHDGLIRDALGPMLGPWLQALGADVVATRWLGDDAAALRIAIERSPADLVITTGGTAGGPVDHVHPVLRQLGAHLLVDGVAVRPGHPMLLARLDGRRHLVGLPGNPLAAVSGLMTFAEPLLRTLAARPRPDAGPAAGRSGEAGGSGGPSTWLPLADEVPWHPRDTRLVPVRRRSGAAVPLHFSGPAMLRGISVAHGLAVIPPGGVARGDEVEVLGLPWMGAGGVGHWPGTHHHLPERAPGPDAGPSSGPPPGSDSAPGTTTLPAPDAPTSDARTSDTPATDTPATDTPATDTPATGAPATGAPATGAPATGAPTPHARTSEPVAEQPHALPDSSLQGAVREQPEGSPPRARTDTTRSDNNHPHTARTNTTHPRTTHPHTIHPHTARTDDVAPERERDRPEARPPGGTE
ncbi:molybdopterin-binding protein [Streptomyces buecherae]|uniref:molybdopterin-binding protein n=1 Tax=Streptomyces buecherae TaxID=2763006 RepID=UPI002F96A3B4